MIEQIQDMMRTRNEFRGTTVYTERDIENVPHWEEKHMKGFEKLTKKDLPLWLCTRALSYELKWSPPNK